MMECDFQVCRTERQEAVVIADLGSRVELGRFSQWKGWSGLHVSLLEGSMM